MIYILLEESYVYNQSDLIEILHSKPDKIIITGEYATKILGIMRNQLSENETLGIELGSAGLLTILAYAIESIIDLFSKEDKETLYLNKKLKAYKVESINNDQIVLKLKQLDY